MKKTMTIKDSFAPRAWEQGGAVRRAAMTLLLCMLTAMTAWAQLDPVTVGNYTFTTDSDEEGDYYVVDGTAALDALAAYVNGGGSTEGKRFKQTDNIKYTYSEAWNSENSYRSNFTAIGYYINVEDYKEFCGTYDGGDFTISGIRIYKGDTSDADSYQGLFGYVFGGTVKNVTLADARIIGYHDTGGIVGDLTYGTVSNCRVASNVAIHSVQSEAQMHGGVVGRHIHSIVSDCFCAATVSTNCKFAGAIAGYGSGTLQRNSYIYITCKGVSTGTYTSGDVSENDGAVGYSHVALGSGISASDETGTVLVYDGTTYCRSGSTVTLSGGLNGEPHATTPGYYYGYTLNGYAIPGNTFTMPYATVTVGTGEAALDWALTSTGTDADHAYIIACAAQFDLLAERVNAGESYSGKYFKLGSDLPSAAEVEGGTSTVTPMVGSNGRFFSGTFDGDGHTLTVSYNSTDNYLAPFHYVNGATLLNLRVAGTITIDKKYAGGLVGWARGAVIIRNCRSSVTIDSKTVGTGYHGGFVGYQKNGITIEGCVFDGSLLGINTKQCGGFVGYSKGSVSISNSLFAPTERTISSSGSKTFVVGTGTITNSYYTANFGNIQGYLGRCITADENVTVSFSDEGTEYNVSGVTAYAKGMKYDDKLWAYAGRTVSLTLDHQDPEGTSFLGYRASDGILKRYGEGEQGDVAMGIGFENRYELTMPHDDVTISGVWGSDLSPFGTASGADGTALHPYTITTTDGLDLLATLVNDGMDFAGQYFQLGADIAYTKTTENNYTPIGDADHYFKGTFDGLGHEVGGININRPSSNYQALFGRVSGGSLKNIIVSDATITGLKYIGAVVAYALDAYNIQNCYYRNVTFGVEGARDNEGDRVLALQTLTLGENISTSTPKTLTIGDTDYYAEGTTVELSYSGGVTGQQVNYIVDGKLIDGNKFNMPAKDVTVNAQVNIDFTDYWGADDGSTAETPYVISNVEGLNLLANMTRAGGNFADKFFKLGDDIDLGGYYFNGIPEDFNGTFDGKGKTISSIDINGTDGAGFFYRLGGTVTNLTLQGKVTISGGEEVSNTARVGGIALLVSSSGSITGCQSLLSITSGLNAEKGGVAGKNEGTVSNCHYLGTCSAAGSAHSIGAVGSGNTVTSCTPLYQLEGLDSETLGTVEVTNVESTGIIYGGCYHAAGSALTLALTATEKEDYAISGYYFIDSDDDEVQLTDNGDGTYGLTMPSMDVTIEAKYSYDVLAKMDKVGENHYLVKTMADLRAVAKASLESNLSGCMGMTFLLDNDIEDAGDFSGIAVTPAGSSTNYAFYGTFDGQGHTISGLNIVGGKENVGFIGSLDEIYGTEEAGTVMNLTLKNCSVTNINNSSCNVGMLVGSCSGGKLVKCRVLGGSVMASSDQASAGAIVGSGTLATDSKDNYYDQKVGVFVDGEPQTPGKCGTGDPDDDLAQAMVITLADDDDNSSDIWTFRGVAAEDNGEGEDPDVPEFLNKTFEVTLSGRTLWKDGKWNTLCLPFALSADEIADGPLAGADIRTLAGASFSDGTGELTLDFTPQSGQGAVSSIKAGKPYIIKWAASSEHIVNPVFQGVTLDATDRSLSFDLDTTEGEEKGITFSGTYDAMTFDAAEPSILFLGGSNTLYYPQSGAKIGAQRAYFQLDGLTAGDPSGNGVRSFVLNFGDEATGVTTPLSPARGAGGEAWYSLDGRRLSGKPTVRGIYIHEGRKVVIRSAMPLGSSKK